MLVDEIKAQLTEAMRNKDTRRRDLLRVVMGELQTVSSRTGKSLDDEQAQQVVRKIAKSVQEMIDVSDRPEAVEQAKQELAILESLLPKTLSMEEIVTALEPVKDAILGAGNDGQAIGIAMKHLKSTGAAVEGRTVGEAVRSLRASS